MLNFKGEGWQVSEKQNPILALIQKPHKKIKQN